MEANKKHSYQIYQILIKFILGNLEITGEPKNKKKKKERQKKIKQQS